MADYLLSFAGVPFCLEEALKIDYPFSAGDGERQPPPRHKRLGDLIAELNRIIPFDEGNEFQAPGSWPGRSLQGIAYKEGLKPEILQHLKIGTWFYPTGATRFSVFRGLATSSMVKAMLAATGGSPSVFIMRGVPDLPVAVVAGNYSVSTSMYMMPPRPLAEHIDSEGLYLVTLVDERFYFRDSPTLLRPNASSTWVSLLAETATALGITLTPPTVSGAYSQPEPDSPLWSSWESASTLLDALAFNIGCVVVRNLDGTYKVERPEDGVTQATTNRAGVANTFRIAGGDSFHGSGLSLAGNLNSSKNTIAPATIRVTFPKYVQGDDPVPHFLNTRNGLPGQSRWLEDAFGDVFFVNVPIASGGPLVSGLVGVGTQTVSTTAKALLQTEGSATPDNNSGLTALAVKLAQDRWAPLVATGLDEVYPGIYVWTPESIHDIVWTYSAQRHLLSTRVIRGEWNQSVESFQHAAPPLPEKSIVPNGIGGLSVAQTVRTLFSGAPPRAIGNLLSGDLTATFSSVANLPTHARWKGSIDGEVILFEGTSGGTTVGLARRGMDGTLQGAHGSGNVTYQTPQTTFGVNLTTYGRGQFVFPDSLTSGGINGVKVLPQTQSVQCLDGIGTTVNNVKHYSGVIYSWDLADPTDPKRNDGYVWAIERNAAVLSSGRIYDGQLIGFSAGSVAPVYAVTESATSGSSTPIIGSGAIQSGMIGSGAVNTINIASGAINNVNLLVPLLISSGYIASGAINVFNFPGIYYPFSWCWSMYWCCANYSTTSGNAPLVDWALPSEKPVINVKPSFGDATLRSIQPNNLTSGTAGPQVLVLNNVGPGNFTIYDRSDAGASGITTAYGIVLPLGYSGSVQLRPSEDIGIWYDTCSTSGSVWRTFWCTRPYPTGGGSSSTAFAGARATAGGDFTGWAVTSGWQNIPLDSELYDTSGFHSNLSGSNTKLTVPAAGYYHIGANVHWVRSGTDANSSRQLRFRLNDASTIAQYSDYEEAGGAPAPNNSTDIHLSTEYHLGAGDYVELQVQQTVVSGISFRITLVPDFSPGFWIHEIH